MSFETVALGDNCCPGNESPIYKHILAESLFFIWTGFKNTIVKNNIGLQWAYSVDGSFSNWVNLRPGAICWLKSSVRVLFSMTSNWEHESLGYR